MGVVIAFNVNATGTLAAGRWTCGTKVTSYAVTSEDTLAFG